MFSGEGFPLTREERGGGAQEWGVSAVLLSG
jgi:hypothetical protein